MFWGFGFEILHPGEKLPCSHFRAAPSHRSLIQNNRWTTEPEQAPFWPLMLCCLKASLILCSCHLFEKFEATARKPSVNPETCSIPHARYLSPLLSLSFLHALAWKGSQMSAKAEEVTGSWWLIMLMFLLMTLLWVIIDCLHYHINFTTPPSPSPPFILSLLSVMDAPNWSFK